MNAAPTVSDKSMEAKWYRLLFGVRRSIRYHTHRRKIFERISTWYNFLVIISGGTVFYYIHVDMPNGAAFVGVLLTVIGSLDLVIGFDIKARDYHDLARQFSSLEREMVRVGDTPTYAQYADINNKRLEIEEDEPPVFVNLNRYCHNEQVRAEGRDDAHLRPLTRMQIFLMHICDWGDKPHKPSKPIEQKSCPKEI